jgi:putative SOS response-associated peptidase YedK
MRWGLVPSFAKEPRIGSTFNCRDDSLAQNKSLWQGVKQRNRCLVLAEGYYEWKKHSEKDKVPYFIKRKDGNLMCLAGLWDRNTKVNPDYEMYTYTVITTDAHKGISWLHDRMPVILDPDTQSEEIAQWLDPKKKWCSEFQNMLKPFDSERLEIYQVSPDVGKLSNDYKGLTQPVKNTLNSFFAKGKRKGEQGAEKKDVKKLKKDPEQPDDNQKTEPEEQKDQSKDDPKPSKEDDVKKKANEDTPKKKMSPRKAKPPPSKNTTLTSFFTKK